MEILEICKKINENKQEKDNLEKNVNEQLHNLSKLSLSNKLSSLKLLLKIFDKIISYPNEIKYKDLNYNIITEKFNKFKSTSICINLLLFAGFKEIIINKNSIKGLRKYFVMILTN